MNILLLNHYAGSRQYGMEFRPYYMSREWVKQGHNVTIVASSFSHLRSNNPIIKKDFQEEMIDGIRYVWLKGNAYCGSIARIRNIASFVWKLQTNARKIVRFYKPDLVIASSTYPLDNLPAHKIAKLSRAKHCYEAHDIWPLSPMIIGGYSKYHPFIKVMQCAENYACRRSDKVISLLWNSEEHYKECGLKEGKFACVPNGFAADEWKSEASSFALPKEHKELFDSLSDKIIVGFAGGFAASGSLNTLIDAAIILKGMEQIQFVLVGKGPEKENYESKIAKSGISNVHILPAVPKLLIPAVISHFDIAFIGGVHSILHKYGTSANKLTDYMLSGKPIIQAIDEPGSLVDRIGCGIQVEAENPVLVADAIVKLYKMPIEERTHMGIVGKQYTITYLNWEILSKQFLEIIKS